MMDNETQLDISEESLRYRYFAGISENQMKIEGSFSTLLHKSICCGYSLDLPRRAIKMSTHSIWFYGEIRNSQLNNQIPTLSVSLGILYCHLLYRFIEGVLAI